MSTEAILPRSIKLKHWLIEFWPEYLIIAFAVLIGPYTELGVWGSARITLLLLLQNAAFTFVSRARQSKNLQLHAMMAIFSNGFFIFILTTYAAHYDNIWLKLWYIVCTTVGSVHAHSLSISKIEEAKRFKKDGLVSRDDLEKRLAEFKASLS
jgi:hypothetical protein